MAKFEWDQALSVGDAAIDADHQGLFALVRELDETEITVGLVVRAINRLETYAAEHFARDEVFMRTTGYPGLEAHIKEHQAFVDCIEVVKATYRRAPESVFQIGDVVNAHLKEWLVNHIQNSDMKYRDFAVARKAQASTSDA